MKLRLEMELDSGNDFLTVGSISELLAGIGHKIEDGDGEEAFDEPTGEIEIKDSKGAVIGKWSVT